MALARIRPAASSGDSALRLGGVKIDLQRRLATRDDEEVSFTPIEFRLLETLYPGRIDLGVGRGGADPATTLALHDGAIAPPRAAYDRKVRDLLGRAVEIIGDDT